MNYRRIVAGVIAIVLGPLALWMSIHLASSVFNALNVVFGVWVSLIATVAILCGWFALSSHRPASRLHIRSTLRWGFIVGGIGFMAGFLGPVIFQPEANQGPLLGIFVTGPLGFVLGTVISWFYGRFHHEAPIESASDA